MADGVKISSLTEATDAQMTDAGLIETAVADTGSSTGFSSKKASFGRLAGYILNKFSGLSLAGASQTVKSALDSLNSSLTNLSSGTILDYVKSQVVAGVSEGHFVATQNVSDIPASGTGWFVHYTRNIGSNIVQLKAIQYNDSRVIYNTHIGNYQSSTAFAREWTQEPTASDIGNLSSLTTTAKTSLVDAINEVASSGGGGMTEAVKAALLQIAQKVAYIDQNGQTYYNALYAALYPPANLVSISAVYTQSGTVYETDTLDSLKADLVVTATYENASTETITSYALSGVLNEGTSTITVSYGGKTTTFNVTVSEASILPEGFQQVEFIKSTGTQNIITDLVVWDAATESNDNSVLYYSMDIDFEFDSWQSNYATNIMAAFGSSAGKWIGYTNANQKIAMGTSAGMYFTDGDLTRHSYHYSVSGTTGTFTRDDNVSISRTVQTTVPSNVNFNLFYYKTSTSTQNDFHFAGKLYSCVVYKNNNEVLHLYPCYRKSDGEIGLYDTVNDRFYTNDGTGTFLKGSDV